MICEFFMAVWTFHPYSVLGWPQLSEHSDGGSEQVLYIGIYPGFCFFSPGAILHYGSCRVWCGRTIWIKEKLSLLGNKPLFDILVPLHTINSSHGDGHFWLVLYVWWRKCRWMCILLLISWIRWSLLPVQGIFGFGYDRIYFQLGDIYMCRKFVFRRGRMFTFWGWAHGFKDYRKKPWSVLSSQILFVSPLT